MMDEIASLEESGEAACSSDESCRDEGSDGSDDISDVESGRDESCNVERDHQTLIVSIILY